MQVGMRNRFFLWGYFFCIPSFVFFVKILKNEFFSVIICVVR